MPKLLVVWLVNIFTWWNSQTIATRFFTWKNGTMVGSDIFGNKYYVSKKGNRWVTYSGDCEPSKVPTGWHAWLHGTRENTPNFEEVNQGEIYEIANNTGTVYKWNRKHSIVQNSKNLDETVKNVNKSYTPWQPQ